MITLPEASPERVMRRLSSVWGPRGTPTVAILAMSGAGKSTLVKELLALRELERAVIFDPKQAHDGIWGEPGGDSWGAPVPVLAPRFGYDGPPGGGPRGFRWRITGSPDRPDTARRFAASLAVVQAEGHALAVLEDYREVCRQLGLAQQVDSLLNLSRASGVSAIVTLTEIGWAAGRSQAGIVLVGATQGLEAAKAGAALLGHSGRDWYELTGALRPYEWIYCDQDSGPVRMTALPGPGM